MYTSIGGVVFVSHDERLIEICADELWVVNKGVEGKPGSVSVWQGSYEAYKAKLQDEFVSAGLVTNLRSRCFGQRFAVLSLPSSGLQCAAA